MSKFFRHLLLISAIFSIVAMSAVHGYSAEHDTLECSVCLYQTHSDLHSSPANSHYTQALDLPEYVAGYNTRLISLKIIRTFYGRAPPQSA